MFEWFVWIWELAVEVDPVPGSPVVASAKPGANTTTHPSTTARRDSAAPRTKATGRASASNVSDRTQPKEELRESEEESAKEGAGEIAVPRNTVGMGGIAGTDRSSYEE